jgi:hypothetical protein
MTDLLLVAAVIGTGELDDKSSENVEVCSDAAAVAAGWAPVEACALRLSKSGAEA